MDKAGICELIDYLTIEMLDLMEQRIRCAVDIEKRLNEGYLLMAKARYINGAQSVNSSKLPTENSPEFNALTNVIIKDEGKIWKKHWILQIFNIDKTKGYLDPLKWFGILAPRCLQLSKDKFQKSIDVVVEYANIQNELNCVMCYLHKVKYLKNFL